jgi:hypothetical protein
MIEEVQRKSRKRNTKAAKGFMNSFAAFACFCGFRVKTSRTCTAHANAPARAYLRRVLREVDDRDRTVS